MYRSLVAFALLAPASAFAYETNWAPWNDETIHLKMLSNLPTKYADIVKTAVALINQNPTKHKIALSWDDDSGWGTPNGESEIGVINNFLSTCPNAGGGCTWYWYDVFPWDAYLTETDVVFSGTVVTSWQFDTATSSHQSYRSTKSGRPFLCTALHELGHAMGLNHENDRYNIMGQDWNVVTTNGANFACEVGADAMAGIVAMYGANEARVDIGMSHWRYNGKSPNNTAYSRHGRTRLFKANGTDLLSQKSDDADWDADGDGKQDEPVYKVTAGSTIKAEITLQNASTLAMPVPVTFYLSTDKFITTADAPLGTVAYMLDAGKVTTPKVSVAIPAEAALGGQWYLGAIVDSAGVWPEDLEDNNAGYLAKIIVQ